MRTEISDDSLDRYLREFLIRGLCFQDVCPMEAAESLEHSDCALRRVTGKDGKAGAIAVGFQFLFLAVTSLKQFDGQRDKPSQRQVAQAGLDGDTVIAVIVVHMLHFVA